MKTIPRVVGAVLIACLCAYGQKPASTLSPAVENLIAALDDTNRALEIKLHDANQKIDELTHQIDKLQAADKEASTQLAVVQASNRAAELSAAAQEITYRATLVAMLERFRQEDADLQKELLEKRGKKGPINIKAASTPIPASLPPSMPVRDLLQLLKNRLRERDVVTRALLADRLGDAGMDVLEAAGPPR